MLAPRKHKLLIVTDDDFKDTRKIYDATTESLNKDIDILIEWFNLQPHLPKIDLDRDLIERLYIVNKCSIERTKQRLDMRFTSKVLFPEWFYERDPQAKAIQNCFNAVGASPMRKLLPDHSRLNVIKIMNPDPELFNAVDFFKLVFMLGEVRFNNDYCLGDTLLIDIQGASFGHVLKINPQIISKSDITNKKVFGAKLFGIHILNGNALLGKFIAILKQSLKGKLVDRIYAHSNYEDLQKYVPKSYLPEDYGGSEKSVAKLFEDWKEEFNNEKLRHFFLDQDNYLSDESKRAHDNYMDEMLGMPGSFKQLVID